MLGVLERQPNRMVTFRAAADQNERVPLDGTCCLEST